MGAFIENKTSTSPRFQRVGMWNSIVTDDVASFGYGDSTARGLDLAHKVQITEIPEYALEIALQQPPFEGKALEEFMRGVSQYISTESQQGVAA